MSRTTASAEAALADDDLPDLFEVDDDAAPYGPYVYSVANDDGAKCDLGDARGAGYHDVGQTVSVAGLEELPGDMIDAHFEHAALDGYTSDVKAKREQGSV